LDLAGFRLNLSGLYNQELNRKRLHSHAVAALIPHLIDLDPAFVIIQLLQELPDQYVRIWSSRV
jgi:hypothetical protein